MIAIIDYGVGNLFSVKKAFLTLGANVCVTNNVELINAADKIVLPGVGAFGNCINQLYSSGLHEIIIQKVQQNTPVLGICVGLQLLFEWSEESPESKGLGLLQGHIKKITTAHKIPHVGWNALYIKSAPNGINLFHNIKQGSYVYFVHSYHAQPADTGLITCTTNYGEDITASITKNNVCATQFHPEKSGEIGLQILSNFIQA